MKDLQKVWELSAYDWNFTSTFISTLIWSYDSFHSLIFHKIWYASCMLSVFLSNFKISKAALNECTNARSTTTAVSTCHWKKNLCEQETERVFGNLKSGNVDNALIDAVHGLKFFWKKAAKHADGQRTALHVLTTTFYLDKTGFCKSITRSLKKNNSMDFISEERLLSRPYGRNHSH